MKSLITTTASLIFLSPLSFGAITYVDAVEGASGNTFATGGSLADMSWVGSDNSNANETQWSKRPFANGGTAFQAFHNITPTDTMPELTTQITGLTNAQTYDIWVFFWDATGNNFWNISAGLTSGALTTYSFDGLGDQTQTVAASTLTFTNASPVVMTAEGNRIMYGVNLGQVTASGTTINVFVDNLTGEGGNNRTWYDGVGFEAVTPIPSAALITSLSISGNSATVVMKGAPGTDYYCAGSGDLTDWTTEVVPTDTPGSPFQTNVSGDLTFTVDISSLGSSYFFRVQDTDPSP